MAVFSVVAAVGLFIGYTSNWFFFAWVLLLSGYALVGRFYHDAALRRRIRYKLSNQDLTIWIDGRETPECMLDLFQLRNLTPQFVTRSGRGTIELPPGGWATQPDWTNRWDKMLPAMYPCRRLELIDDVEKVADLIRRRGALR